VTDPDDTPVTIPLTADTVAILISLLLHLPPVTPSDKVTADPGHTADTPLIMPAAADGFTVMIFMAAAVPQLLLTV
jgi:hypothetical protein